MVKQQAIAIFQQALTVLFPFKNPNDDPDPVRAIEQIAFMRAIALFQNETSRPGLPPLSCIAQVSESIYSSKTVIVPLADVQHIEKYPDGQIVVISKHTRWDFDHDRWANPVNIAADEADAFRTAWCRYRSELEADSLADLAP